MKPGHSSVPPELVGVGPAILRWIGDRESSLVRALWRITIEVNGLDAEVFSSGPTIIAANHRSLLDTVVLRYALDPKVRVLTATVGARDFFAPAPTNSGQGGRPRCGTVRVLRFGCVCPPGTGSHATPLRAAR